MRAQFSLSRSASFGRKVLGSAVALWLCFAATTVRGLEPVTFYGFDAESYSPTAQEGLQKIFAGELFRMAIPASAVRLVFNRAAGPQKAAGYEPGSAEALFYTFGRLPSPPTRTSGGDPGFALGESVFQRDGATVVNINCFACHAGVVNGQVVAGLGNNHINQSDPRKVRTRGDNFGPYEVWRSARD